MFEWLNGREKLFEIPPNYIVANNHYDRKKRIITFHQLWFIKKGKYCRICNIEVRERSYSRGEIYSALPKAKWKLLKVTVQRRVEGKPARLIYTSQKVPARRAAGR